MMKISEMPKYDDYVDSGVEWLGRVPSHWQIIRLKNTINGCVNGLWGADPNGKDELVVVRVSDFDEQKLNVSDEKLTYRSIPENERKSRLLKFGDLLIEKSGGGDKTLVGRVVLFDKSYTAVTSNFVAKMTPKNWVNHSFLKYVFFSLYSRGVNYVSIKQTTGIQNLDANSYLNEVFCFPDEFVQAEVANFLDKKTALIDEAIAIKEKQINLLKEHKQIIIQQAVTQGLDPNVPMKDSGVDWIGKIPAHWDLVKLGSCLSPVSVKNCSELPLLSITREQGVIERDVDDKESNHNFIPDDLSGYKKLEKGQFGMNKMKAWQGSYGVSKFTGIVSPAYFIFDFTKAINPEFFNWAIRSKLYVSFFGSASDGVRIGQWDLSKARMKVIPFVLPSEEEQLLIAKHLDEKLEQVDVAIKIKLQQIERLREYRSSLINSAVTGKIKITPEMVEQ